MVASFIIYLFYSSVCDKGIFITIIIISENICDTRNTANQTKHSNTTCQFIQKIFNLRR